jgi:hypothetical protein
VGSKSNDIQWIRRKLVITLITREQPVSIEIHWNPLNEHWINTASISQCRTMPISRLIYLSFL